jgi:transposase-like protein
MGKTRKRWALEQKLKVLKEARLSGASIAEVCRRHQITTSQYYQWEKIAEEGSRQALGGEHKQKPSQREERLQRENERLRSVVLEITAENLDLKKSLGE